MKKIYRVEVEVAPMEGTTLPDDWSGAFVNVFIASNNIVDAIKEVESLLYSDQYKPTNTYAAFELDLEDTDFDTGEEGYPNNQELLNLKINGGYWYGPFHGFPPENNALQ